MDITFIIRKSEPRDLGAVNKLLQQVLTVHHRGRPDLFRETGKKYTDEELLDIFDNPDTPVFVYEKDDLCVEEGARGKHVGKALFEYVKAYAEELGCHNVTLHVWECNPGARAFYDFLGLKPQYTSMELILK